MPHKTSHNKPTRGNPYTPEELDKRELMARSLSVWAGGPRFQWTYQRKPPSGGGNSGKSDKKAGKGPAKKVVEYVRPTIMPKWATKYL